MARVSGHVAQILRKNRPQAAESEGQKIVAMVLAITKGRH
jgi:hypothetical protein